ncbi:MAG: BspA family leucine-rich repeat surface protein, partial [Clostridia bacterium]|nr:BspA family leucine-rich repeat surface protein [Clostridia bacterium]
LKGWYQNGTALASNDFNSQNTSAAYAKIAASGNGCYLTNINLKSTLESLQSGMLVTGAEFNQLVSGSAVGNVPTNTITQVIFGNKTTYASAVSGVTGVDVTANSTGKVKFYLVGTVAYILHETDGTIYANPDCSNMFNYFNNTKSILFNNFDTRMMTNMERMFYASAMTTLDLSGFDVSHVTNLVSTFEECEVRVIYVASTYNLNLNSSNTFKNCANVVGFYYESNQLDVNGYVSVNGFDNINESASHACIATSSNMGYFTNVSNKSRVEAVLSYCIGSLSLNSNTTSVILGTKTAYASAVGNATGTDVSLLGNGNIKSYYVGTTTYILNENNQTTYCLRASSMLSGNKLTSVTWGNFNTRYTTNMNSMFNNCSALTSLNLTGFDTRNTVSMTSMFNGCSKLTSLNLTSFSSAKLYRANWMFYGCTKLTDVTFNSNFTCTKVTDSERMFYNCTSLVSPGLENFVLSSVMNMSNIFYNCTSLVSIDLGHFTPNALINMDSAFNGCTNLGAIFVPSTWNLNLTTSSNTFNNCNKLVGYYPSGNTFGQYAYDANYKTSTYAVLPTSGVRGYLTDVQYKNVILVKFPNMLISGQELNALIKGGVSTYNTENTKYTKIVFGHKTDYTAQINGVTGMDITIFQTGRVKLYKVGTVAYILHEFDGTIYGNPDSRYMFYYFSSVRDIVFDHFDTSQVTDIRFMFYYCKSLSVLNLSGFDVSNVLSTLAVYMTNWDPFNSQIVVIYVANDWAFKQDNGGSSFSSSSGLRGFYLNNNNVLSTYFVGSDTYYQYARPAKASSRGYYTDIALKSQVEAQNLLLPGRLFNAALKGDLATTDTEDYVIKKIVFGSKSTYSSAVSGVTGEDVSLFGNNRIKLYRVGSVAYVLSENSGTIYATNAYMMFSRFKALEEIVFENFDTSQCTDFEYMFYYCSALTSLDISGFNFSLASSTGLQQTFCYCTNLSIIYVASNFTNPYPCSTICFRDCTNLSGYYVKNN